MSDRLKCYKIRIESPFQIIQTVYVAPEGLTEKALNERERDKWNRFGRLHKVKVKLKITKIPCSKISKTRQFFKEKK